uniref:Uncharacterized protein n=1 Tax=Odontella aurita TaxID=265563 RepID=A0A7S4HQX4_9STRA|mmetsp:Transcript_13685/g.39987  ORF Transcript_13685/g.39987 Transcript_13685/m.39987 type:complete len:463 (+) Transcript_13685:44-1432(+)
MILMKQPGVDRLRFSPWGLVSGLFWVPGGAMHICGVRTAGLAVSHGLASSLIVMVSFTWGIFVFHERVKSLAGAMFAIFLMICGISGMSYFSAPPSSSKLVATEGSKNAPRAIFCIPRGCFGGRVLTYVEQQGGHIKRGQKDASESRLKILDSSESLESQASSQSGEQEEVELSSGNGRNMVWISQDNSQHSTAEKECDFEHIPLVLSSIKKSENPGILNARNPRSEINAESGEIVHGRSHTVEEGVGDAFEYVKGLKPLSMGSTKTPRGGAHAIVSGIAYYLNTRYGIDWTVRQTGLAVSACGAIWGGSIMAPLHYAGEEAQGLGFVFSFAVGALVVNALLWVFRYLYLYRISGSATTAYQSLPCFHLSVMAVPGGLSGFLWSIGNMASMISVSHLGEGVGYSMTQSAMLVSGLWAIFYLGEISSGAAIRGWLASACLTISGILLLSYNHMPPPAPVMLKG